MVGAQDELIFDGQSLAYNGNGELIAQGKAFEEEIIMVDLDSNKPVDLNIIDTRRKNL